MTARERELYNEARSRGERASSALFEARTMASWEHLESVGLVRFRWIPDDTFSIEDLEGDCFDPEANHGVSLSRLARERREFHEKIDREGVWGLQGEFRLLPAYHGDGPHYAGDAEKGWESGDAVWGFVGTDRNGYEASIAYETMRMLREALKARCPRCRSV